MHYRDGKRSPHAKKRTQTLKKARAAKKRARQAR